MLQSVSCGGATCSGSSNLCDSSNVCKCGANNECTAGGATSRCLDTDTGQTAQSGDSDATVKCGVREIRYFVEFKFT